MCSIGRYKGYIIGKNVNYFNADRIGRPFICHLYRVSKVITDSHRFGICILRDTQVCRRFLNKPQDAFFHYYRKYRIGIFTEIPYIEDFTACHISNTARIRPVILHTSGIRINDTQEISIPVFQGSNCIVFRFGGVFRDIKSSRFVGNQDNARSTLFSEISDS